MLTQALETGKLEEVIDPRLEKNYNEVEMLRMMEAAAACVRHSASRRPRMSQVCSFKKKRKTTANYLFFFPPKAPFLFSKRIWVIFSVELYNVIIGIGFRVRLWYYA